MNYLPEFSQRLLKAFLFLCILVDGLQAAATTTLNVKKDFGAAGNGRTDDTKAFLAAVREVNRLKTNISLIIPPGSYIIRPQLQPNLQAGILPQAIGVLAFEGCTNLSVVGTKDTHIIFGDSLYYGSFRINEQQQIVPLGSITVDYKYRVAIGHGIALKNCKEARISGLEIDGNNADLILGSGFGDTGFQIDNDGLFIENSSAVSVKNCYFHHFGRDGFFLLNATPQGFSTPGQNIALIDCRFEYNGRQGFSWVGGVGVRAVSCSFSYTAQGRISSAPRAGVDFEPNAGYIARDGVFTNCTFYKNQGVGIITDEGAPYVRDFRFINCKIMAGAAAALWIKGPVFRFSECQISGSFLFGCAAETNEDGTQFTRCDFTDEGTEQGRYNYLVESNGARYLLFDSCSFKVREKVLVYLAPGDRTDPEKPVFNSCLFRIDYPRPSITAEKAGLYCTHTRFTGNTRFKSNTPYWCYDWNIATSSIESWKGRPANVSVGKGFSLRTYEQVTVGGNEGSARLTVDNGGGLMIYNNAALTVGSNARVELKRGGGMWLGPGVNLQVLGRVIAADGSGICIHADARISTESYGNINLAKEVTFGDNKDVQLNLNTCKQLIR